MPPRTPTFLRSGLIRRRQWSRSLATSASEAAEQLMHKFRNTTVARKQILDGNQLQRLCLTLGRPTIEPGLDIRSEAPPDGTPIPPGWHLVYFTPAELESSLGPDGTDRTYNAAPFSRRMWAGGQMTWSPDVRLRVGDIVEERTSLRRATPKRSRSGGDMVLVDVRKEFHTERGLALIDQRSWIFRPPLAEAPTPTARPVEQHQAMRVYQPSVLRDIPADRSTASVQSFSERHLRWSPVALFRFSALTFNAHMIHYNETWTRAVEGHPDVVVHGPLNLINMLDCWRDVHHPDGSGVPKSISYRALAPIYAGEDYAIKTSTSPSTVGNTMEVVIDKGGSVCMTGTITSLD